MDQRLNFQTIIILTSLNAENLRYAKKLLLSKLFLLLCVFVAFTRNLDGGKYKYF